METKAEHADGEIAHVVDEFEVNKDVFPRLRERPPIPHDADRTHDGIENLQKI